MPCITVLLLPTCLLPVKLNLRYAIDTKSNQKFKFKRCNKHENYAKNSNKRVNTLFESMYQV